MGDRQELPGRTWLGALAFAVSLSLFGAAVQAKSTSSLASMVGPSVELDARGLPSVLSQSDIALYREIFALQEAEEIAASDALVAKLTDRRLMGHVLAERYLHPTAYRPDFAELTAWLDRYGDHPQAERLHALARKRAPDGSALPRAPQLAPVRVGGSAISDRSTYRSDRARTPAEATRVRRFEAQIRRMIRKDRLEDAETALEVSPDRLALDPAELDQLQGYLARAWYSAGRYKAAYNLAASAAMRSGWLVPNTHWLAGLSAWQRQDWDKAARHFEAVTESPKASPWLAAGGAYWASRAHLRRRDPGSMSRWLSAASGYPRTFYGLIAREALGLETAFDFQGLDLTRAEVQQLVAAPSGGRALALLQVGRNAQARAELLLIGDWRLGELGEILVALTNKAEMPGFSFTLARQLSDLEGQGRSGRPLLAALYPLPDWQPDGGFAVDRALVYAVMRQESAFDPGAVSQAGARGLMQLMPKTAGYISGDPRLGGSRRNALLDPGLNLRLGQDYLVYLMTKASVGDDLFSLLAAYNAGPGSLQRWQGLAGSEDDALLFMESLPYGETRAYIEKVLANYWIYRKRLGQETPSLSEVADGDWPRYRQLESGQRQAWIPEP
ncbi:MAG: lytic transglycosylase domain-containing protein [Rhodospirillales bacterium]